MEYWTKTKFYFLKYLPTLILLPILLGTTSVFAVVSVILFITMLINRKDEYREERLVYLLNRAKAKANFDKSNKRTMPHFLAAEYTEYLGSKRWKQLKHKALLRDNHRCVACNIHSSDRVLQGHHVSYEGAFDNFNFKLENIHTICIECPNQIHHRS